MKHFQGIYLLKDTRKAATGFILSAKPGESDKMIDQMDQLLNQFIKEVTR